MIILPDELIVFSTLDAIAIVWMVLKLLVTHWIDSHPPPNEITPTRKAA
jgi:hypothetical protein